MVACVLATPLYMQESLESMSSVTGQGDSYVGHEENAGSTGKDNQSFESQNPEDKLTGILPDQSERDSKPGIKISLLEDSSNGHLESGTGLSDAQRASRRAEEAANRRYEAARWLQKMVGPLSLSSEPTEEELKLCLRNGMVLCILINKVHPGTLPKIVNNPPSSSPPDGALSAYQYFENVRNFLVALEDLGMPSFEASDLEQGSCIAGSMAKVVNCILNLKSFCEWRDGGALGQWKYACGMTRPGTKASTKGNQVLSIGKIHDSSATPRSAFHPRKGWAVPLIDSSLASETQLGNEVAHVVGSIQTAEPASCTETVHNGIVDAVVGAQDIASNSSATDSTADWIHNIGQKFREVLQVKAKKTQHVLSSENSIHFSMDSGSFQSLPGLVKSILADKNPAEIPQLVEFMLRKVMEEFERRLVIQNEQMNKMKHGFKKLFMQTERRNIRGKLLDTLAVGSAEELKIVMNQLQHLKMEKKQIQENSTMKEEQSDRLLKEKEEKIIQLEALCNQAERIKLADHEQKLELELQKKSNIESNKKINELETLLVETQMKLQELQASSSHELEGLRWKELRCRNQLNQQLRACQGLRTISSLVRGDVLSLQTGWQKEIETLREEVKALSSAAAGYHKVLAENRELYNEVQDLKGNIRVYCRVRPSLGRQDGKNGIVDYIGESGDITIVNPVKHAKDSCKTFTFNKGFGPSASQEDVFQDTKPLIRSVLDGYNVCIFAYGQTGSGKTYTMSGPNVCTKESWGVNYRALDDLFQLSQKRKDVLKYEIGVQMIEIYNEQVRDLLISDGAHKRLEIRNNSQQNGLNVPDASMISVKSTADVLELMNIGQKNRAIGATALNERSSRSHSVLTVHVQGLDLANGSILRGCLHLVDLAGSERVDKSEAIGDRLREAQHINKSLSALGDVISALAHKNSHVPYRNSKLTQLLQDSLGGQAKTLMFVHINSDMDSYGETISTLKFAERVASVELGAARSNKESGQLRDLKEQVTMLKEMLVKKDVEISKRDAEISKRDSEIAQIQEYKSFQVKVQEPTVGIEKPKFRNQKLSSCSPRLHKVMDAALNVEAQTQRGRSSVNQIHKWLSPSVPSPRGSFSDEADKYSEVAGPVGTPKYKSFGEDSDVLRLVRNPDSEQARDQVQVNCSKQNGRERLLNDQEASLKDWKDRIQSSTESLLTSASLDEEFKYWDSGNLVKFSAEAAKQQLFGCSPPVLVDVLNRENVAQQSTDCKGGRTSFLSDRPERHIENGTQLLQAADFEDRFSELSEGGNSLETEAEGSFSSIQEPIFSQRSSVIPLQRSNIVDRRSSHLSQIPRPPSRSDRRAHKGESAIEWPKSSISRQQPLLVNSGIQSKTSKRWH